VLYIAVQDSVSPSDILRGPLQVEFTRVTDKSHVFRVLHVPNPPWEVYLLLMLYKVFILDPTHGIDG
jgi:hypothetical protein